MVNSYYEKISQTKSSPSEFDQPHNTPVKDWWILWRDFTNIYSHRLSSPSEFDQLSKSCKNTWVTLTTFLGCLNCINVTKECYQIGLSNEVLSLFSSLVEIIVIWIHSYPCNKGTPLWADVKANKKPHQNYDLCINW